MVGDDAQRSSAAFPDFGPEFFVVINAAEFCSALHQRNKKIGVVIGDDALQHGGDAFEAHASVHTRLRQGSERAAGIAVELHEHEVPDFDVSPAIARKFAVGVAFLRRSRPHVIENLAARSARAGVSHGPEVVFESCDGMDAFLWHLFGQPTLTGGHINLQHVPR